jgi:hypothetical protein
MLYAECVRGLCATLQDWWRSSKHVSLSNLGGVCNTAWRRANTLQFLTRNSVTSLMPYRCTGTLRSPCIMFKYSKKTGGFMQLILAVCFLVNYLKFWKFLPVVG